MKEVRKRIAEENNISLEIEECTYKGECRGSCPRCEAEVRYLENALSDRLRLGKVATIAGLTLGLAATVQAQDVSNASTSSSLKQGAQHEVSLMADSVTVRGIIRDRGTGEEVPFCRVHIVDYSISVDIDTELDNGLRGSFAIKVPKGNYYIWVTHYGYKEYGGRKIMIDKDIDLGVIELEQGFVPTITLGGVESIPISKTPPGPISKTPPGHEEYFQGSNGATIIVR